MSGTRRWAQKSREARSTRAEWSSSCEKEFFFFLRRQVEVEREKKVTPFSQKNHTYKSKKKKKKNVSVLSLSLFAGFACFHSPFRQCSLDLVHAREMRMRGRARAASAVFRPENEDGV